MRAAVLAAMVAFGVHGAASAQSQGWLKTPPEAELQKHRNSAARLDGVAGHAVLHCRVQADGRLAPCGIKDSQPPFYHFGEAALEASKDFRVDFAAPDAPTAGTMVDVVVDFPATGPDWALAERLARLDRLLSWPFFIAVGAFVAMAIGLGRRRSRRSKPMALDKL